MRRPLGTRRLLMLAVLCLVAIAAATLGFSAAAFTGTSTTTVTASAADVGGWLDLYSQSTDPNGDTGYATQRVQSGVGPLAATGSDHTLAVDLGGFPDKNKSFTFERVITLKTPATFPDSSVTQVTVTATLVADPATGDQPLSAPQLSTFGNTAGGASITMLRNTKYQFGVTVNARKQYLLGQTYSPQIVLTLSYTGGPAGYYVWTVPVQLDDAGF
jgi:hypothetical protein